MAKSTRHHRLPSPMTTTEDPINAGEHAVFLAAPQVPTSSNCSPYFLNTESSPTQVHCQRLRVASLLLAA